MLRTRIPSLNLVLLLACWSGIATAQTLQYDYFDEDDQAMGHSRVELTAREDGGLLVDNYTQLAGEKMFIDFSMENREHIELDRQGVKSFRLQQQLRSSVYDGDATLEGRRQDDQFTITLDRGEGAKQLARLPVSAFDTIISMAQWAPATLRLWQQSAPFSLRQVNLMNGEVEQVRIEARGEELLDLEEEALVLTHYLISGPKHEMEVWLLPDGRIYRSKTPQGSMVLQLEDEESF